MSFTKGNWYAESDITDNGEHIVQVLTHLDGEDCPTLLATLESFLVGNGDGTEAEANAHLIAAAPDMYEALSQAHNALCILRSWIRQALAKAEGREA